MRFFTLLFVMGMLGSAQAWAFPELIRHGYTSCTACHLAPSGGGALTPYGRQLSGETVSKWKAEAESQFAYGYVPLPDGLLVGGDARGVWMLRDTPQAKSSRFILMQGDIEVAGNGENFYGAVSGGTYGIVMQSRKHYVGYRLSLGDPVVSLRVGRFEQAFGLMGPYHTEATRRGLNWDEGSSTYNLEAYLQGEVGRLFVTLNMGRPDNIALDREKGLALRGSLTLGNRAELGLSGFYGKNDAGSRVMAGPFFNVGFSKELYLLSEMDFQRVLPNQMDATWGWAMLHRLGYEVSRGLHGYLTAEQARPSAVSYDNAWNSYGVGSQFFPRPHTEFNLQWLRRTTTSYPDERSDYVTFLIHYYL